MTKHGKRRQCFLLEGTLALRSVVSYVNCTASLSRWWILSLVLVSVHELRYFSFVLGECKHCGASLSEPHILLQ